MARKQQKFMVGYALIKLPDGTFKSWGKVDDLLGEQKVEFFLSEEERNKYKKIMMENASIGLKSSSLEPGRYQIIEILKN